MAKGGRGKGDKLLRIYLPPTESDVPKSPPETPSSNSVAYAREANSVSLNSQSNSARTDPRTTRTNNEPVIRVGGPLIPGLLISPDSSRTTHPRRSNQKETGSGDCCCFSFFLFVLFVVVSVVVVSVNNEKEKNWLLSMQICVLN